MVIGNLKNKTKTVICLGSSYNRTLWQIVSKPATKKICKRAKALHGPVFSCCLEGL